MEYDTYTSDPKTTVAGGSQAFKQFVRGTAAAFQADTLTTGDRLDALVVCSRHPDYEDVFGDSPPEVLALGYGRAMRGDSDTLYIYDPGQAERRIDMGNGSTLALASRTSCEERKERVLRRRAHACIRELSTDLRRQGLRNHDPACVDCKVPLRDLRRAQGLPVLQDEAVAEGDHGPSVASLYEQHVKPYASSGQLLIQPSPNHHEFTDGPWKEGVVRDLRLYFRCPPCHRTRTLQQNEVLAVPPKVGRAYDAPEAAFWTAHALLSYYGVALEPVEGIGTDRDALLRVPANPAPISAASIMRAAVVLVAVYVVGFATGRSQAAGRLLSSTPPPSPPCSPPPPPPDSESSFGSPAPTASEFSSLEPTQAPDWLQSMSPTPSKEIEYLASASYGMTPSAITPQEVLSLLGKPIAMPDIAGMEAEDAVAALFETLQESLRSPVFGFRV